MPQADTFSLTIHDLAIARADQLIVEGLSTALKPGQSLQIFGPNGSGKSTILKALAGLLPISRGKTVWQQAGESFDTIPAEARIYLSHHNAMKSDLSVRENMAFWTRSYGVPMTQIARALERVELSESAHRPAGQLSAGQKRRLGLARCLLADRPLWLVDEPTANLDRDGQAFVQNLLEEIMVKGGMVIAASHHRLNLNSMDVHLERP